MYNVQENITSLMSRMIFHEVALFLIVKDRTCFLKVEENNLASL